MKVDWIVSADACAARIYSIPTSKYKQPLTLLQELTHVEGRMKSKDLVADEAGKFKGRYSTGGQFVNHTDPKAVELNKFVKKIVELVEHGHSIQAFEKLIVVARPHLYGLIVGKLSDHIKNRLQSISHKDRMHGTEQELHAFIQAELIMQVLLFF
jgi:protein required for attachment to host cells